DLVLSHGADAFRVYEMFLGPLEAALPWNTSGVDGARKWLDRVYRLFRNDEKLTDVNSGELDYVYHQTVKKVTHDIETLNLNTAISQMMIFINECYKVSEIYREYAIGFLKLFSCFAPHLGEELYQTLTGEKTVAYQSWPTYDESKLVLAEVTIVVQVNGKIRGKLEMALDSKKEDIIEAALEIENVAKSVEGLEIIKTIVVPNKLVNLVVK
ncbi:MAG: class I tRNA ligase family protein, partial [Acholeplasmataceae bacterium]